MSVLNPIDPALLPRLNQQYVEYYNAHLANVPMIHQLPWKPDNHNIKSVAGGAPPLPISFTKDVDLGDFSIRLFYPTTKRPLPVMIWYHGGGMVLGSLDAENAFCTRLATAGQCAVMAVDYRLAPEHKFPDGANDAWTAFKYVVDNAAELGVDATRLGIGGFSSGGNLAAMVSQRAGLEGVAINFVVLSVPLTDNTATADSYSSWDVNRNCPGLSVEKMLWYREQYLPKADDRALPVASPLLAPDEWIAASPNEVYIAIAGIDLLRSEGEAYAARLKQADKDVVVKIYEDVPHLIMAMDGAIDRAREWNRNICAYVALKFGQPAPKLEALYDGPVEA